MHCRAALRRIELTEILGRRISDLRSAARQCRLPPKNADRLGIHRQEVVAKSNCTGQECKIAVFRLPEQPMLDYQRRRVENAHGELAERRSIYLHKSRHRRPPGTSAGLRPTR